MRLQLTPLRRQRGVALVTAILLVALATALATKLAWDNHLNMRRTQTFIATEQSRLIALGGEAVAISLMREMDDFDLNALNLDVPAEIAYEIDIEDTLLGVMQGSLRDATARFNLNNLVQPAGWDQISSEKFSELLNILQAKLRSEPRFKGLQFNPGLVDNIVDWIDSDTIPFRSGAEDGSYTSLEVPVRPANNYFISASELRSVLTVDELAYAALKNYVTALPPGWCRSNATEPTKINLNTASQELMEALDPTNGPDWVQKRGAGYENISDVIPGPGALLPYVSTEAPCFELHITVAIGSSVLTMYSLLERSGPNGDIFTTRVRTFGLDREY